MFKKNKNISYGVIAFKIKENTPYYCMICRKDSFSYSEFIRGKYELEDVKSIYRVFRFMTENEKTKIILNEFETLWDNLWVLDKKKIYTGKFKREFNISKYKFDTLKRGYITTIHTGLGTKIKKYIKLGDILNDIVCNNSELYNEPEWGFPKGKKNENESSFDCAKREFNEETNIPINTLNFLNYPLLTEKFIADNLQEYTHIYYLAQCSFDNELTIELNNYFQISEISSIQWLTFEEALNKIRTYSSEKIKILSQVHSYIKSNFIKENLKINT